MSQKKATHKKKSKAANHPQGKMHLIEVASLLGPIEGFVRQLKQGEVWVNENGEALMDLPGEQVEDLARKGQAPRLALPNLMIITEIYFQVAAYCFDGESMQTALNQIRQFRHEILDALKEEKPIEHEAIEHAEQLIVNMKTTFLKSPRDKVARVINEIMDIVQNSADLVIQINEARAWLVKKLIEVPLFD